MGQILTAVKPLNARLIEVWQYTVQPQASPHYFNLTAQRTVSLRLPEEVTEGSVPFLHLQRREEL